MGVMISIWLLDVGLLGVVSSSCFIEGADSSSTKTPGGTFALSDPSLARTSAATFESRRIWSISSPWNYFSSFHTSVQYSSMVSLVQSQSLLT